MKRIGLTMLKGMACGFIFFGGTILGGLIASLAGFATPAIPEGTDSTTLAGYLLLASLGIGGLLGYLAFRMTGSFLMKWITLSFFGWVVYSLSTYIEAAIYTTFSSASLHKVVMDLIAFLLSSAAAVILFRAKSSHILHESFSRLAFLGLAWRVVFAWVAFPLIYLSFGKLIEPLIMNYYLHGLVELTAPGWEQIISAQMVRSLLFLGVCLAIIYHWRNSRVELWIGLTMAHYLLVGGFYMLQAYWFPFGFRAMHCMEIFADSLIYISLLTVFFKPKLFKIREAINPSQTGYLIMAAQNEL